MDVLITGANRGIGLGLVQAYLARGDTVLATARDLDAAAELHALVRAHGAQLALHRLEVTDPVACAALGEALAHRALDLLINNAGIGESASTLEDLDLARLRAIHEVNCVGPLQVSRALLPALRRARGRIAHISSMMGSIADNASGRYYGYRMSKAALNMATRCMARELQPDGIAVYTLHPGWVKTDMGGQQAPTSVEESAAKLVALLDRLGLDETGRFYSYEGHELPW